MKKYKFTKIIILILVLIIGAGFAFNYKPGRGPEKTLLFTHPEFEGYELLFSGVRGIYDGDTILLTNNYVIRYLGIDTPEMAHSDDEEDEPGAVEATEVNRKLLRDKKILVVIPEKRGYTYDRLLAYIYAPVDGYYVNVTKYLLKEGMGDTRY